MEENKQKNGGVCFVVDDYPCLAIETAPRNFYLFFRFLQHGFFVVAKPGESVKSMLCDRLGVDSAYAENRIKTIFLNGKPVDDMEKAFLRDGCSLALSAAMPGLVGATFRSGGVLSPFRAAISYRPEECEGSESEECAVHLKLFNLLVPEMGPTFLANGIFVDKNLLEEFFRDSASNLESACESSVFDGKPVDVREISENGVSSPKRFVFLKVGKAQVD